MNALTRKNLFCAFLVVYLSGCTHAPKGIEPVTGFELDRYLGQWFEIARLDHSFERGLTRVTADYSLRDDGGVDVVNRGYDARKDKWKSAEGRAYFVEDPGTAHLKVSFFGPFYGAYVVFGLDPDYRYALVSGPDRDYLWILAREPDLDQATIDSLVTRAAELGFPTHELIFVPHE